MVVDGQPRRLISTGLNGTILEWDLVTRQVSSILTTHSSIWDSRLVGKLLYLACEDGSIRIAKVKKGKIEHVRTMTKSESRCLCLEVSDKVVWAGYADSSVRRWDLDTGNCTLHFQKSASKALIWCIKLHNSILITGDSQGDLSLWDSQHGTLLKQFNQLKADILQVEINPYYDIIYASGVDSRILSVQLDKRSDQWVFLGLFRGQSHDVKALVRTGREELCSGGNTTDVCIYKLR